jgi:hypothetical protein
MEPMDRVFGQKSLVRRRLVFSSDYEDSESSAADGMEDLLILDERLNISMLNGSFDGNLSLGINHQVSFFEKYGI